MDTSDHYDDILDRVEELFTNSEDRVEFVCYRVEAKTHGFSDGMKPITNNQTTIL